MLVLSRQFNETIRIGSDISITVVQIQLDKVRLGIVAPSEIPVHRLEVFEAIQREGRKFTRPSPTAETAAQRDDTISAQTIRSLAQLPEFDRLHQAIGVLKSALRHAGYTETVKAFDESRQATAHKIYVPTNGSVYNGAEGTVQS